jgi:hypothetical protein
MAPTAQAYGEDDGYQSPYRLEFSIPREELLAIDETPPRNDHRLESKTPHEEWYSRRTRKEYGAWGPVSRQYPPIPDRADLPPTWKRQRLLAVAHKYVGLPYQHHHIPDWDPPRDWPWKPVAYGRNSKGVDCSDFTSWVYNYGLGIRLDTGIREQANAQTVPGAGGEGRLDVEKIRDDNGYDDLVAKLKTGDLLYIRNNNGVIGHVIMWVGVHGRSPDGTPLIIDCTGMGHKDANGVDIPIGVHLRPFGKDSWYYKSFAHANRIIRG